MVCQSCPTPRDMWPRKWYRCPNSFFNENYKVKVEKRKYLLSKNKNKYAYKGRPSLRKIKL